MEERPDSRESFSSKLEEQNRERSDNMKLTFEEGQLSFLGNDVEVLPRHLIKDYCDVTSRLDLSFNKLRSLDGLENFLYLKELVLDNNELDDSVIFPHIANIHTLTLNKNKLTDLDGLLKQLVKKFHNLTYLSLLGNTACPNELSSSDKDDEDYQRYRYYVLYKLPGLKFLDSSPVTAEEVAEAKRVGPYTLVVRPKDNDPDKATDEASPDSSLKEKYSPLHDTLTPDYTKHHGQWVKNKSKYIGRNSEGNRFITDGAL